MRNNYLLLLILFLGMSLEGLSQTFQHPGVLHKQSDFDRMKAKVDGGEQPWTASYDKMASSASLSWTPRAQDTIIRSDASGGNVHLLYNDVAVAYKHAVLWKITGNTAHGDKAVEILNDWSSTHVHLSGDAGRYLASGLFGYQFANAAEIMRDYPGFELQRFQNYLLDVYYYPLIERFLLGNQYGSDHNDACISNYWANWDLCNMAAMLAIGVFCDNREIYDKGIEYFKGNLEYFKGYTVYDKGRLGNGSIKHAVPYIFNNHLGQWQESGRDQGHSILGVGLMASFCEIAWNQGDDMYGYENDKFRKGAEYVAKYNMGEDVPYTPYSRSGPGCGYNEGSVISTKKRGEWRNIWELIYKHYGQRLGETDKVEYIKKQAERHRPEGGPGGHASTFDQPGFGTLTQLLDFSCLPDPITPYLQVNWGVWQQTSTVMVDSGSTIRFGPQPITAEGWTWSTGETTREITVTNLQQDSTFTAWYTNTCGARERVDFIVRLTQVDEMWAQYSFEQSTIDSTSNGLNATAVNGPVYAAGQSGSAIVLDGTDDHVTLPAGIVSDMTDITIATWVKLDAASTWSRIFDFGSGTSDFMLLTPYSGIQTTQFIIKNGGEDHRINADPLPIGEWTHVAVTLRGNQGILYVNGEVANTSNTITLNPSDIGNTTNNYLGRSQYADPYLDGSIDEFRIYNYALEELDIKKLYDATPDPKVSIVSPVNNDVSLLNRDITIEAEAIAYDAVISKVEFYSNGMLLGEDNSFPYEVTWQNAPLGNHVLTAVVTDDKNQTGTSDSVSISVIRQMTMHYAFENDLIDGSGNGNDAVAIDSVTYDTGQVGMAVELNGSDQYISLPTDLEFEADEITISGWVNPDQLSTWTRVFDLGSGTDKFIILALNSGGGYPRFIIKNGGSRVDIDADTTFAVGAWSHFAITYADFVYSFYINGELVGQNTYATLAPKHLGVLTSAYLGKSQYGQDPLYDGSLDDFRVYNYALNTTEIAELVSMKVSTLTIQESELGFCGVDGTVDNNHAGYTGSGFANTSNALGNGIDWNVDLGGGMYTIEWRFANGGGSNRPADLIVNGNTVVSDIAFNSTGSWASWDTTSSITVTLDMGTNNLRLEPTTSDGLANIDYIQIIGINPEAGSCSGSRMAGESRVEEEFPDGNEIKVYPNPTSDFLNISVEAFEQGMQINVFDLSGRPVLSTELPDAHSQLNLSRLKGGIYLLEITGAEKPVMFRFIKR